MTGRAAAGRVEVATRADLRRLGVSVQRSGLAAGAVQLARLLDAAKSASEAATGLRELRMTLGELASLSAATRPLTAEAAPAEVEGDGVDDIAARRAARRSAG